MRAPPKMFCRECGRDLGRGWATAPLGGCCKTPTAQADDCLCAFGKGMNEQDWNPRCPVHVTNPHAIPF